MQVRTGKNCWFQLWPIPYLFNGLVLSDVKHQVSVIDTGDHVEGVVVGD